MFPYLLVSTAIAALFSGVTTAAVTNDQSSASSGMSGGMSSGMSSPGLSSLMSSGMLTADETETYNPSGVILTNGEIEAVPMPKERYYTVSNGRPYYSPYAYQRAGKNGPLLLQDFHLIDLMSHFDSERVPERVVHAKGAGAHGYFETTADMSHLTAIDLFSAVGNRANVTMRFSTVAGEMGSADTVRDPRGFSIKMRTKTGILDWVFNNTPVFFIRDPTKFPAFIHTQKRNPQTNLKDPDMFWDYLSSNPESFNQIMRLFSDAGTPDGFQHMNGWSGHTYKWVKKDGSFNYVKIKFTSDMGIRNLTLSEANTLVSSNPDYNTQYLFETIKAGQYPSWTVSVQVMNMTQAENYRYSVFDLTKIWPESEYPLIPFGKVVLDKNPTNYFAEIEQAAFSPSNTVFGWEPSEDPVLQARLFSYPDTQRHRLGTNYQKIPVNCPYFAANYHREGHMVIDDDQGSWPNYPSTTAYDHPMLTFEPPVYPNNGAYNQYMTQGPQGAPVNGTIYDLSVISPLDFEQPRALWLSYSTMDQDHFVSNVIAHLGNAKSSIIKSRTAAVFAAIDPTLGKRIAMGVNVTVAANMTVGF